MRLEPGNAVFLELIAMEPLLSASDLLSPVLVFSSKKRDAQLEFSRVRLQALALLLTVK